MEHGKEKATCNMPLELLSAYLDNELSGREKEQVADHLNTCPHCRRWVEECKKIEDTIREAEIQEPSTDFMYQLKNKVLSEVGKKKRVALWRYLSILAPVAAVLLIIILKEPKQVKPVVGMEYQVAYTEIKEEKAESPMPLSKTRRSTKQNLSSPIAPVATEIQTKKTPEWNLEVSPAEVGMIAGKEIIRAMVDSTGRVVNVARGKSLSPEEDTTLLRLLKGKKIASPRLQGRPSQVFIEIPPESSGSR
ncbi:MAG: anti-sigma factor [candidate division WOR-3 bacterium]